MVVFVVVSDDRRGARFPRAERGPEQRRGWRISAGGSRGENRRGREKEGDAWPRERRKSQRGFESVVLPSVRSRKPKKKTHLRDLDKKITTKNSPSTAAPSPDAGSSRSTRWSTQLLQRNTGKVAAEEKARKKEEGVCCVLCGERGKNSKPRRPFSKPGIPINEQLHRRAGQREDAQAPADGR